MGKTRTLVSKCNQRRRQKQKKRLQHRLKKHGDILAHSSKDASPETKPPAGEMLLGTEALPTCVEAPCTNVETTTKQDAQQSSTYLVSCSPSIEAFVESPGAHSSAIQDTEITHETSIFDTHRYRELIDEQDCKMMEEISDLPIQEQCDTYKDLFLQRTQNLHYYRDMADEQKLEIEDKEEECREKARELKIFQGKVSVQQDKLNCISGLYKKRINNIRMFWKNKVYEEHSRAGTIFRNSLIQDKFKV